MDYIIDKLNEGLEINEKGSYDYVTYLRERIEYILFFLLGYLWNKNYKKIDKDILQEIIANLYRMSIGTVIDNIRKLDIEKEILNKHVNKIFEEYPSIRNSKIGHGYSTSEDIVDDLINCYAKIIEKIPLLKKDITLVVLENDLGDNYNGIKLQYNMHGRKERWTCPKEVIQEIDFPSTYAHIDGSYYKLSPFIMLLNRAQDEYIFSSLEDTLSGNAKLCPLFGAKDIVHYFSCFSMPGKDEENRLISLANNTIKNIYEENFKIYHEIGVKNYVIDFLNNQSSVSATLWGHGGVGKTACIQNVCQELFSSKEQKFAYIIFVTAKDRIYKPSLGKVVKNDKSFIRTYSEIISEIMKTVFDENVDVSDEYIMVQAEEKIVNCKYKMLIVIDDYETFDDKEKEKINLFIQKLSIQYHKVVITTRNTRFVIGQRISTNELGIEETKKFLLLVLKERYPEYMPDLSLLLDDDEILKKIHNATSGRPIFIYQFVFLYVQEGYKNELFDRLQSSNEAIEFLYGRVYTYLSQDSKNLFVIISQIINDEMVFRIDILSYISSKVISGESEFEIALQELYDQKIIEQYGDLQARVYSPELCKIMSDYYKEKDDAFKSTILNLLNSIGGKNMNISVQEALLVEADKSRVGGNIEEIVSKYKRVLKTDVPLYIKKKALLNLASFYAISILNTTLASNVIEEYLDSFRDDPQVINQYVDYLWQQDNGKSKADIFLRTYFGVKEGHRKNDIKYFNLFAKAVGYCSNYDLTVRKYRSEKLKSISYKKTINEYGRLLFEFINKPEFQFSKQRSKHLVKVGLLQTVKMCEEINDKALKIFGVRICKYADANFDDKVYHNQFMNIRKRLEEITDEIWDEIENSMRDQIIFDARIEYIKNYGLFLNFGRQIQGFAHKTNLVDLIEDFKIGQVIKVQIVECNKERDRVSLRQVK